jgi:hypothetical protein
MKKEGGMRLRTGVEVGDEIEKDEVFLSMTVMPPPDI